MEEAENTQHDGRHDPLLAGVGGHKDWTQHVNRQKSDPNILHLQNYTLCIRRQKGMYCANTRQTDIKATFTTPAMVRKASGDLLSPEALRIEAPKL